MPAINLTLETIQNLPTKGRQYDVYDAKEPGLILRVNASGSKTYIALYGRGKRKKIGDFGDISLLIARQKTKELLTAANKGQLDNHLQKESQKTAELTYQEYLDTIYLSHLLTNRETGIETYKMLKSAFSREFPSVPPLLPVPLISKTKLSLLSFQRLQRWVQDAIRCGLEPSSVNRYMRSFKASLTYAIDCSLISENPAKKIEYLKENDTKERYIAEGQNDEEFRFYKTINKYPIDEFRVKVTVGIQSGARPCEVAKLIICDIDLRRQHTQIWFECAYTKTKKKRYTPLTRLARITLYLYMRKKFRHLGINLFKTYRRVEALYQTPIFEMQGIPDSHRKLWDTFMEDAKIEKFTPYDMRHDFISKFVMKTSDTYTCAKLVGTSIDMIEKHYGHLAPKHTQARIAQFDPYNKLK